MSISYLGKDPFPKVIIDADTLQQFRYIVNNLKIEAEWYGFVKHYEEQNYLHIMGEAFVPDQVATGTSANATPTQIIGMLERIDDYCEKEKPDYDMNDLGVHMHSHVNLGTSPSPTDETQKRELVEDYQRDYLNKDHPRTNRFLLKGIMNQKDELFLEIIDLQTLLVKESTWYTAMDTDSLDRLNHDLEKRIVKGTTQYGNKNNVKTLPKVMDFDYQESFYDFDDFEYAHLLHVSSKQTVEVHVEDMLEILELLTNTSSANAVTGDLLVEIKDFIKKRFGKQLYGNFKIRMFDQDIEFLLGEKLAYSVNGLLKYDLDQMSNKIMYGIYGVRT